MDRSFTGQSFFEFIRLVIDKLETLELKNMIFIGDNASIHKNIMIAQLIEPKGHVLRFLPPYSPQLNPIEEAFSVWKNSIRSANCMNSENLTLTMNRVPYKLHRRSVPHFLVI